MKNGEKAPWSNWPATKTSSSRDDANVKLRPLTVGDLVLRKVLGMARNPAWGKLGPN